MRIAVLTWGTRGDLQPLLALALKLTQAGAEVVFGAPPHYAAYIEAHGLAFRPLGTPMSAEDYHGMMNRVQAEANPRKQNRFLLQQVLLPDLDRLYADCLLAAQGADLVMSHWLQVGGGLAAEALGLPWVSVTLHAAGLDCEQELAGDLRARESYSRWIWGERLREFRAQHGLRSVETVAQSVYSDQLNLVAMSAHLLPNAAAWSGPHRVVGFLHLDTPEVWQPDPVLGAFLERHGKVVVVTLGSSVGTAADRLRTSVLEALARMGRPTVVQFPLLGGSETPLTDQQLVVGDVPHHGLLPYARCVVHHGGAGTTAAALRAGVPSLTIGQIFDQPYWGNMLAANGLGVRPATDALDDVTALAAHIEAAEACLPACRHFAARSADEPGAAGAAQIILQMFGSRTPQTFSPVSSRSQAPHAVLQS